jgi:hypothetical protein
MMSQYLKSVCTKHNTANCYYLFLLEESCKERDREKKNRHVKVKLYDSNHHFLFTANKTKSSTLSIFLIHGVLSSFLFLFAPNRTIPLSISHSLFFFVLFASHILFFIMAVSSFNTLMPFF